MSVLDLLTRADAHAPMPLTVRQLAVLLYLARVGQQEFGGVRDALGLSPGPLSRAADALSSVNLLKRMPSGDGRVPLLALTEAGKTFVAEVAGAP